MKIGKPEDPCGGLVVDERHRKRGFGRTLVAVAESWAQKHGVAKLRVRTKSGRAEAHSFFEGRGFRLTKEQRVYDKDRPRDF